ncbi:MAG: TrmH family RNA methyltransferase [Betaproteobacteria bacterium]
MTARRAGRRCYDARAALRGRRVEDLQPAQSFRHCPSCGRGVQPVDGRVLICPACGFHFHFNPAGAAGVIVSRPDGRVLLLRRALAPSKGLYGLPGGFVDAGEGAEQALRRETREETGLEVEDVRFLGGWPNLYAWCGIEYPVLDLYFTARARADATAHAREEVAACVWAAPGEIDPATLAFDSTRAALARYRERCVAPASPRDRALHVVLVEPEIHWNTGNAGRTCLAAGAQLHLVEPLGFSLDERELRRAGLDYWERVAPRVWPAWDALEAALPGLGEPFFASPDAGQRYWDARYPERTVLVFGRESIGLPAALRERYRERLVRLPMHDPALRSVNVSTCVGILLYEVLRQWQAREPAS